MTDSTLFPATLMPDNDWWQELWPDPLGVLEQVGIQPHMQVLDLCCGDGLFTEYLCQLTTSGKTWALDMDPELLKETQQRCKHHAHFRAIQADARKLIYHLYNPIDFVFMANTFHGVPDKTGLSKSVYRVLKPGGYFAIINWHHLPREDTTVLEIPRGPDTELRMPPEELEPYVEDAGFVLDQLHEVGPYHYGAIFLKPYVDATRFF